MRTLCVGLPLSCLYSPMTGSHVCVIIRNASAPSVNFPTESIIRKFSPAVINSGLWTQWMKAPWKSLEETVRTLDEAVRSNKA